MDIATVGIIGAGTMGSGIATNIAQHGRRVVLVDSSAAQLERARQAADKVYRRNVDKGRMSAADADAALARIEPADAIAAAARADLVIEAVFEDLELKRTVLAEVARNAAPGAIVATNTSCLRVDDLAGSVGDASRFLGLHYFSPAAVNPLVEVVRGRATADDVIEAADAFCHATEKQPLHCRDSNGYVVNRFFCPYVNEGMRLVDEGVAEAADIDRVARDVVGAAAGPFVVTNLVKARIMLHATRYLASHGAFYEPAACLVAAGDGDREWPIGEESAPDPARDGIVADRLLGGTFLPVLQLLDEGVAEPAAVDIGAKLALKFGKPPCQLMDRMGAEAVERVVAPLCERYGAARPRSLSRVGSLLG